MNQTTRWLANSSFKTYFGKPVFANYGQGNVKPAYGGLMYGDYMKTHNIAPHEGANNPATQQVYEAAETKGLLQKIKPPQLPRKCKDEDRLSPNEIENIKKRSQVLPKEREKPSKKIIKPDLAGEKFFKSEHNSANQSYDEGKTSKKGLVKLEKKEKKDALEAEKTVFEEKKPETDEKQESDEAKLQKTDQKSEKSHDVEVQAEDCPECITKNYARIMRSSYQDMTAKVVVDKNNQIIEPYKYCARCRDCLFSEDPMRPPYSLAEIPVQELDPKNYKTLPPQWTQRIPAAGKLSYRSPSAYNVIFLSS